MIILRNSTDDANWGLHPFTRNAQINKLLSENLLLIGLPVFVVIKVLARLWAYSLFLFVLLFLGTYNIA